ncbi:MAG: hypothetical protein ABL930_08905, partial [Pseudobdellovibrio sp.]
YKTDPERLRNDARTGIISPNSNEQYELQRHKNLDEKKSGGTFGLGTTTLECIKTEFALDVIGTLLGAGNHSICIEYNYSYWLRLNWSCESEKDYFVKNKTLSLSSAHPQLLAFDNYNRALDPMFFKISATYDSVYTISKDMYDNLDHLILKTEKESFTIKRSALSFDILLPDSICNTVSK